MVDPASRAVLPSGDSISKSTSTSKPNIVVQNALRYSLSPKEYETLHRWLLKRSSIVSKRVPPPSSYKEAVAKSNTFNDAAIRASLRVFLATTSALKIMDVIKERAMHKPKSQKPLFRAFPALRLSLSLSMILLLHRFLYRFFSRLRVSLLTTNARPFCRRNPRLSRALTCTLAPAVGASLAGFALGLYPATQLRLTLAILVLTKSLEFGYNALENDGWFRKRPWWFGSWMLQPLVLGQLFHAFVFDRDCFPEGLGKAVLHLSPAYIQERPDDYPAELSWPEGVEIVDGLKTIANLKWPRFTSPILTAQTATVPPALQKLSCITSRAHPMHTCMSCALLHARHASCLTALLTHFLVTIPRLGKGLAVVGAALCVSKYRALQRRPLSVSTKLISRMATCAFVVCASVGMSWSGLCVFAKALPGSALTTRRVALAGFLAGLPSFLARGFGRPAFTYGLRASLVSAWRVLRKRRGWPRGWEDSRAVPACKGKGKFTGDVFVFVAGLMLLNVVYDADERAVEGRMARLGCRFLRGTVAE